MHKPFSGFRVLRAVAALVLVVAAAAARADFSGEVIRILDGDTVEVLVDQKPVRVRLAEIDAPEKGQPFGTKSRHALAELTFRRQVVVIERGTDRYGRVLGIIQVRGQSANRAMVADGAAWAYRDYLGDRSLLQVEAEARAAKRGLWADPAPMAPWVWRRQQRATGE